MAIRKCSTSVQRALTVSRRISQSDLSRIPRNAREAVLQGADLLAGSFTATDDFAGPHAIVRRGEVQPDVEHGEARFAIPYVATIRFGRPRPVAQEKRS
jgi:hypothetical protein